jgi:hypothetical protein
MTTTTDAPNAPVPAGADWVEDWEGEGDDLGRFFHHPAIENGEAIPHIIGVQYANGCTGRSVRVRVMDGLYEADFTPARARDWAAMLLKLADTCEILDSVEAKR